MHSARTDRPRAWRPLGLMQRLNVRLVVALASVALIALLICGAALNQILPGYFVEQAETRAEIAAAGDAPC